MSASSGRDGALRPDSSTPRKTEKDTNLLFPKDFTTFILVCAPRFFHVRVRVCVCVMAHRRLPGSVTPPSLVSSDIKSAVNDQPLKLTTHESEA